MHISSSSSLLLVTLAASSLAAPLRSSESSSSHTGGDTLDSPSKRAFLARTRQLGRRDSDSNVVASSSTASFSSSPSTTSVAVEPPTTAPTPSPSFAADEPLAARQFDSLLGFVHGLSVEASSSMPAGASGSTSSETPSATPTSTPTATPILPREFDSITVSLSTTAGMSTTDAPAPTPTSTGPASKNDNGDMDSVVARRADSPQDDVLTSSSTLETTPTATSTSTFPSPTNSKWDTVRRYLAARGLPFLDGVTDLTRNLGGVGIKSSGFGFDVAAPGLVSAGVDPLKPSVGLVLGGGKNRRGLGVPDVVPTSVAAGVSVDASGAMASTTTLPTLSTTLSAASLITPAPALPTASAVVMAAASDDVDSNVSVPWDSFLDFSSSTGTLAPTTSLASMPMPAPTLAAREAPLAQSEGPGGSSPEERGVTDDLMHIKALEDLLNSLQAGDGSDPDVSASVSATASDAAPSSASGTSSVSGLSSASATSIAAAALSTTTSASVTMKAFDVEIPSSTSAALATPTVFPEKSDPKNILKVVGVPNEAPQTTLSVDATTVLGAGPTATAEPMSA